MTADFIRELKPLIAGRWALWRNGHLVHLAGDFNAKGDVASLRKTWHALTVGAAIKQNEIPAVTERITVWAPELKGVHAEATWWHVITQTSGFDYPYGDWPAQRPGQIWTYSDKNPRVLCNALARVYGKKDFHDDYSDVVRRAYFDAIGLRGWQAVPQQDGIRFHFDLEDMGRLGLLVLNRGRWGDREIIPQWFVEQLERKQTGGIGVNYDGPDDGKIDLDPQRFPEAPYGFMTWVNTDGDFYPGADRAWAWAAGAGGTRVLWNRNNGIVLAAFGADKRPSDNGIPQVIERSLLHNYPPSPVIQSVSFDDGSARTEAPGSDNWPITWAANGNLYTSFGDGGGFGGTNSDSRVSMGIGRIEGDKHDYRGFNIAGGKNAPYPAPFAGKSEGILAIGDVLYLWRDGNGSDERAFSGSQLWRSDDLGASWKFTGVEFNKSKGDFPDGDEGLFALTFCQFGRGYEGARDSYVYIYGPEISDRSHWNVQKPGKIALMRVAQNRLHDRTAYEFFAGIAETGSPAWTGEIAGRKPTWQDPANGTHRMAVSYNAGLKRYLLTTMTVDRQGRLAIYDAPEPWGPWTTVLFQQDKERWGTKVVVFNFVNKWLSADGRRFVLVYTKNDHWASIAGEFLVSEPH